MQKIGLFFGSTTGNTEGIADRLQGIFGENIALHNVDSADRKLLKAYDALIFGTSTWGVGDLQDDFEPFLDSIKEEDIKGKSVAIFGLGDSASYSDTFVDSIGIVYDKLLSLGATMVGLVDASDYTYDESGAVHDDKFVGLPIDEDNEPEKTEERVKLWAKQLKEEMMGVIA